MGNTQNIPPFHHALIFRKDLCIGCSHCMNVCPTEAIRVHQGKAILMDNRCVDCGACFRVCPVGAIIVEQDDFSEIYRYPCRVALIPAVFSGQFPESVTTNNILSGVKELGFTHVLEVEQAVEFLNEKTESYIYGDTGDKPLISPFCPAIVRLIQVKFPTLVNQIIRLKAPVDLTALFIRNKLISEGIDNQDIGIFYVTPCPAKIAALKSPVGETTTPITGVINLNFLFNKVYKILRQNKQIAYDMDFHRLTPRSICWSLTRGESSNRQGRSLAIDEIENVIEFLEKLENEEIDGIDFLELRACDESCAGGILCPGNRFVTAEKLRKRADEISPSPENEYGEEAVMARIPANDPFLGTMAGVGEIVPRSIIKLDDNFADAMAKMRRIYEMSRLLPQVDCGICGSPTCKSLAEDVVQSGADLRRCIFIQRIHEQNEWLDSPESVAIMKEIWGEKKMDINSLKDSANEYNI